MDTTCEIPEFYNECIYTAMKRHKCCECKTSIETGERYACCVFKFDGRFQAYKQHMRCFHFARHLNYNLKIYEDGCIPFGSIDEALSENDDVADEVRYLWWWVKKGYEFNTPLGLGTKE